MALLTKNQMLCFFLCSIIIHLVPQLVVEAKTTGGFTVEIIHRDSTLSPFYNSSSTHGDLARNRAVRSIARANHYFSPPYSNKIESPVIPNDGEYLMKLSIGDPPVEIHAMVDTGSELVWVQCQPCPRCYPQKAPVFNPLTSSTYKSLPCNSNPCHELPKKGCNRDKACTYVYNYEDGSYSKGLLALDTFTFDSLNTNVKVFSSFPNFAFGCGQDNGGQFSNLNSGVVGLGRAPLSLVSQLGDAIQQKFSYCLTPPSTSSASKLRFGPDPDSSTTRVALPRATPLLSRSSDPLYYLNLEGISVADILIVNKNVNPNEGNIIIDSGTTLTMLPSSIYSDLEAALKKVIGIEPVPEPVEYYNLCYETSSFSHVSRNATMVFHFTGASVTLSELNIFSVVDDKTCLAMRKGQKSIYGNVAQMNFHIVYDLGKELVSFAPADCTKF